MKILHILNDVTDRGNGIVNTAVDLAMEQARQGMTVVVVSGGGGYQSLLERAGVQHFTLVQSKRPTQILRAALLFRKQLLDFRPDIVHAHMRTGLLLAWCWRRFYHYILVGHIHNVHDRESIMMGLADAVIAVSQSVANTMAGRGIARQKLHVVLNRTLGNRRLPDLAEIIPVSLARPSIVTVCGMSHRKGIEELISAFELVAEKQHDCHLYLVGDGPQREQFQRQAIRSKYSHRIHFEGFHASPQAYMLSADVFVLASRRESFGLVLIEARQAGCAIIATDVDGISEALDSGRAGMLIPSRNPQALASALLAMLDNPDERNAWKSRALKDIAKYHVDVMAHEVRRLYEELALKNKWHESSDIAWLK